MPAVLQAGILALADRARPRVVFRLSAVLWLYALLASALATFRSLEEYACAAAFLCGCLAAPAVVRKRSRPPLKLLQVFAVLVLFGSIAGLCCSTLARSRAEDRVGRCRDKMASIASALLEYRERHQTLPLAISQAGDGSSRSWREAILPYLKQQPSPAAGSCDSGFCCPSCVYLDSQPGSSNSYFAVTGPGAAWDALQSKRGEVRDDPAETILILEELGRGFDWRKTRDLGFDEALTLLTEPVGTRYVHLSAGRPGFFQKSDRPRGVEGVNAAFADGSVRFIPLPLSREFATALLTANGGEAITDAEMSTLWREELDCGKVYSFSLFVALCFPSGLRFLWRWPYRYRSVLFVLERSRRGVASGFEGLLCDGGGDVLRNQG